MLSFLIAVLSGVAANVVMKVAERMWPDIVLHLGVWSLDVWEQRWWRRFIPTLAWFIALWTGGSLLAAAAGFEPDYRTLPPSIALLAVWPLLAGPGGFSIVWNPLDYRDLLLATLGVIVGMLITTAGAVKVAGPANQWGLIYWAQALTAILMLHAVASGKRKRMARAEP